MSEDTVVNIIIFCVLIGVVFSRGFFSKKYDCLANYFLASCLLLESISRGADFADGKTSLFSLLSAIFGTFWFAWEFRASSLAYIKEQSN